MRAQKRQTILRIAERAALIVAVCDLLMYFLAARPVQARLAGDEQAYNRLRHEVAEREKRVVGLQHLKAALPQADIDLQNFLHDHVPARRWCFSTSERLLRKLTQQSHLQLSAVSPKLIASKDEPLDRLALDITVEGTFEHLLDFAHAIETANDLILVRNFSFTTAKENNLSLKIGTDLYLTP
jgi:Tfp pilus assembly protein PilO